MLELDMQDYLQPKEESKSHNSYFSADVMPIFRYYQFVFSKRFQRFVTMEECYNANFIYGHS